VHMPGRHHKRSYAHEILRFVPVKPASSHQYVA
jgi:hypothetical protein